MANQTTNANAEIESAIEVNKLVFAVAALLARPLDKGMDLGQLAAQVGEVDYFLSIIRVIRKVIRRQSGELANAAEVHSAGVGLFEQYRDLVGDAESFLRIRRGDLCKRIVKMGGEAP